MKLAIRADATLLTGTGHVMRCFSLAQGCRRAGGIAIFITYCENNSLQEKIKTEGFKVYFLKRTEDDIKAILEEESPEWVVLDGYHFGHDYQRAVKELGFKLLVIDDFAHLDRYCADIILNQNFGAEVFSYNAESPTKMLLGTRYALLRENFLKHKNQKRTIPDTATKIIITMGGADPENHTLKAVMAANLLEMPLEIRVIIGGGNPHYEFIRREAEKSRHDIRMLRDVEDMPSHMAWADFAISAGGTTLWELAFMGLPALLCIVADNQKGAVSALGKAGFPIAGWIKDINIADLSNLLYQTLKDRALREKLSKTGTIMVDGTGADKVMEELSETKPVKILFLGGNVSKGLADWLTLQGENVYYTEQKISADFVKDINPDFIISYNYPYILRKDVLAIPPAGAINLHISYLPWNRGKHPNLWSLIENTPKGVTIHLLDEGVDTGDILLQKEIPIDEDKETLKTSYEILHREIQELFKTNWAKLKKSQVKPSPQPKEGTLHRQKDLTRIEHLFREKGWETPIRELKENLSKTSGDK